MGELKNQLWAVRNQLGEVKTDLADFRKETRTSMQHSNLRIDRVYSILNVSQAKARCGSRSFYEVR